jgi:hypothetical protein
MITDQSGKKWYEKKDIYVGMKIPKGSPFAGAKITSISNNGWCRIQWHTNRNFSVRVHQLTPQTKDLGHKSV